MKFYSLRLLQQGPATTQALAGTAAPPLQRFCPACRTLQLRAGISCARCATSLTTRADPRTAVRVHGYSTTQRLDAVGATRVVDADALRGDVPLRARVSNSSDTAVRHRVWMLMVLGIVALTLVSSVIAIIASRLTPALTAIRPADGASTAQAAPSPARPNMAGVVPSAAKPAPAIVPSAGAGVGATPGPQPVALPAVTPAPMTVAAVMPEPAPVGLDDDGPIAVEPWPIQQDPAPGKALLGTTRPSGTAPRRSVPSAEPLPARRMAQPSVQSRLAGPPTPCSTAAQSLNLCAAPDAGRPN